VRATTVDPAPACDDPGPAGLPGPASATPNDGAYRKSPAGAVGWVKPKGAPAGPFTLVEVEAGRRWCSESSIPLGSLRMEHELSARPGHGTRIRLHVVVTGPFTPIFRLVFAPRMRRDLPRTVAALGCEARARSATTASRK